MTESKKIRVLVADDHFVARFGLKGLLGDQPDLEVVGEAKSGAEAVTLARQSRPDVVLMDLRMPGLDGVQATAAILREDPKARVLIVSSYDTEADVLRVNEAGAAGYIMKEAEPEELLRAIRAVAAGGRYLPPNIQARLEEGAEHGKLNARDLRILQHIGEGLSNKEIAEKMSLTAGTVRIYVSNILARLGVANRAEAVSLAIRRGLIRPPEGK
jgi:two-component system NarL family response regulator